MTADDPAFVVSPFSPLSQMHPFVGTDDLVDRDWYSWLDKIAHKLTDLEASVKKIVDTPTVNYGAAIAWGSYQAINFSTPVAVRRTHNLGTPTIIGSGVTDWVFRVPFITPPADNKYIVTGSAISIDSNTPVFVCGLTAGYIPSSFDVWICNLSGQHVSANTFFNVLVHWRP